MEQDLTHFKGKKILITGGGGYLGSKLASKLATSDSKIYLLDRKFNDLSKRLVINQSNINLVEADLIQKEFLLNVCQQIKPDYIFHFGAILQRNRDFSLFQYLNLVNVQGTLNLLESLQEINYKGFYFSSTSEVYGSKNISPYDENMNPIPASPYSLTKLMAENLILTFSEIHNKPFTIFRIFNYFGIDMPETFFINQLIATLKRNEVFEMTAGEQIRDFVLIEDLLSIMISISSSENANKEIVNICTGHGVKLNTLAKLVAEKLNKKNLLKLGNIPYRENEVWEMVGNNDKLKLFHKDINTNFLYNLERIINKYE